MLYNLIAALLTSSDKLGLALLLLLAFGLFLSIYTIFVLHRRVNIREESYEEVPIEEEAAPEEEQVESEEEPVEEEQAEEAALVEEEPAEEAQPEEEPVEEAQPEEEPAEEVQPEEEPAEEVQPEEEPVEESQPEEEPAEEAQPEEEPVEEAQPEEEAAEEPQPEEEPAEESQPEEEVHSTLEENQMSDLVRESVTVEEADEAISDELAEELMHVQHESAKLKGAKKEKYIVNVDVISDKFESGDEVNLETLKEKGLLPKKCNYFKVLARGVLDKKIKVVANEYSDAAIKMILLTGGEVVVLE